MVAGGVCRDRGFGGVRGEDDTVSLCGERAKEGGGKGRSGTGVGAEENAG